jgi:hypothetical protein
MAGPKNVAFRGVQDCKIKKLLTDTTGSLTYDASHDVAIQKLSFSAAIETYELKHDDLMQEIDQVTQSYEIKGTIARVGLDVLSVFTGGAVTATGSGSAEVQTFNEDYDDEPQYFALEMQSTRVFATDGNAGDVHVIFPKCKVTALEYKIEDDFCTIEFTAKAIRTVNSGLIKQLIVNETQTAISDVAVAGTVALSSNVVATDTGAYVVAVVSGTTLLSEATAETNDNYTIDAGTTGLTLASATYVKSDTVLLEFTGTAAAGTLSVTMEADMVVNATNTSAGTLVIAAA